eukprot:jgi/Undpi1/2309/HiC_scaffold_13.g05693.m1
MTTAMTLTRVAALSLLVLAIELAGAAKTASPNDAISKPSCDSSKSASVRYSSGSERLYVESSSGGGCITLKEVWEGLDGKAPLYAVDSSTGDVSKNATGTWLLTESLYVEDGVTLQVYGSSAGGDANELRLMSTSDKYINVRAHGGSLDFVSTKVTTTLQRHSYNSYHSGGRSYISAISEVITDTSETCDGRARNDMGEARLDIEDSEVAYLGYYHAESYGLSWKVRGYCKDKSNPELFDKIGVFGNIYNSDIHHLYFGVYSYGHQQGDWRNNKVHDNIGYGFDPHDDSDYVTIHDNTVYNNGNHGIIASKRCDHISIQVRHPSIVADAIIFSLGTTNPNNNVHDNADAGIAMLESFDAEVSGNTLKDNKYGIRLSVASADNVFSQNKISGSSQYSVYLYGGNDVPETTSSSRPQYNKFEGNTITGGGESMRVADSDGTQFVDNTFVDAATTRFDDSADTLVSGNAGLEDIKIKVVNSACFDGKSDSDYTPTC